MTSTNDGKDVKIIQTSGQKGKTYYIELYKSLEARLNSEGDLRERTQHLCEAWRRVHSLCQHSAPSTHTHLLSWLQRHTSRTVLQTEWQSPTFKAEHSSLEDAIQCFIRESRTSIESRDGLSPAWEGQLLQRAEWFKSVLSNPWGHPVLRVLLDPREKPPTDNEILEWLKEERGVMFVTRLRQLAASKCDDLAMSLATAVMDRVRAASDLISDIEQSDDSKGKLQTTRNELRFGDILTAEAGFTVDVWELLTDIEFVLLHKGGMVSKCIDLAKQTPLRNGYQLVERLQSRPDTSPREKKLWKNSKEVATIIAQVVIARCMVVPTCTGASRTALYCCTRSLALLLAPSKLPAAAAALAAPAATSRHLHTLAAAVDAQSTDELKPFVCELYVRAITSGMNELERLKIKTEKETEARSAEQTLASWFIQLGRLLASSERVRGECTLTAFSVHPTPAMYERIKATPVLPPVAKDILEPKHESTSEFGSWASDSRSQTNFVKTSETLNIKQTQQANVLSTAILTEGEAIGLSAELCQDIAVLLSGPRVKTLTWDMERELLLENCRLYMERTNGGTRALTTELKYLNLDPSEFQHLPEEEDDENDYGIEKGYEHLVEFQEPRPEEIWQDALWDLEQTDSCSSSSVNYEHNAPRRKKKSKHRNKCSGDESDPLSLVAEVNKGEQKKERPHSKERSKQHKKKSHTKDLSRKEHRDRRKERSRSKEKKKEKKECMKKEKRIEIIPEMSQLVGVKVAKSPIISGDQKPKQSVDKNSKPSDMSVSDSDYGNQGKSSIKSLNSEGNSPDVLYDGQFSMDELKSPERSQSSDNVQNKNALLKPLNQSIAKSISQSTVTDHGKVHSLVSSVGSVGDVQRLNVFRNPPKQVIKEQVNRSIAKLLQFRKQRAENVKTQMSLLVGSKVGNPQASEVNKLHLTDQLKVLKSEVNSPLSNTAMRPKNPTVRTHTIDSQHLMKKYRHPNGTCSRAQPFNFVKTLPLVPAHNESVTKKAGVLNAPRQNAVNEVTRTEHQCSQTHEDQQSQRTGQQPTHQTIFHEFLKELHGSNNAGLNISIEPDRITNTKKEKHVSNIESKFEPMKSPQCAKPIVPQNAPNTFARRSYMHKSRQGEIKPKQSTTFIDTQRQLMLQNYVSAELDERIADLRLSNAKHFQGKGDLMITRVSDTTHVAKSTEIPRVEIQKVETSLNVPPSAAPCNKALLESILQGGMISLKPYPMLENQRKQSQVPNSETISTPSFKNTDLSDKDQQDIVRRLRQQSKLNTPITHTKVDSSTNQTISTVQLQESHHHNLHPNPSNRNTIVTPPNALQSNYQTIQAQSTLQKHAESNNIKVPLISNNTILKTAEMVQNKLNLKCSQSKVPKKSKPTKCPKIMNSKSNIMHTVLSRGQAVIESTEKKYPVTSRTVAYSKKASQQDWTSVCDALLAQKTPSRGPNALDMVLKKDSQNFTNSCLRNQRIIKTNVTGEPNKIVVADPHDIDVQNMTRKVTTNFIHEGLTNKLKDTSTTDIAEELKNQIPNSTYKDGISLQAAPKSIVPHNKPMLTKSGPTYIFSKKQGHKELTQETAKKFTRVVHKEADPFISGIPNSDYDLLEELMDDDLRQEIGELSSDEDNNYKSNIPFPTKTKDSQNNKTVSVLNKSVKTISTSDKSQVIDPRFTMNTSQNFLTAKKPIAQATIIKCKKSLKIISEIPAPSSTLANKSDLKPQIISNIVLKSPDCTTSGRSSVTNHISKNIALPTKREDMPTYNGNNNIVSSVNNQILQSKILDATKVFIPTMPQPILNKTEAMPPKTEDKLSYNRSIKKITHNHTCKQLILDTSKVYKPPMHQPTMQEAVVMAPKCEPTYENKNITNLISQPKTLNAAYSQTFAKHTTTPQSKEKPTYIYNNKNTITENRIPQQNKLDTNNAYMQTMSQATVQKVRDMIIKNKITQAYLENDKNIIIDSKIYQPQTLDTTKLYIPTVPQTPTQIVEEMPLKREAKPTYFDNNNVIPDNRDAQSNILATTKSYIQTMSEPTIQKIVDMSHKNEEKSTCIGNKNIITDSQIHQPKILETPNVYIPAIPQPTVQNVVVIGTEIVYDHSSALQVPRTQLHNSLSNVDQNTFAAISSSASIIFQATQYAVPVVNTITMGNTVTKPVPITGPAITVAVPFTAVHNTHSSQLNLFAPLANIISKPTDVTNSVKPVLDEFIKQTELIKRSEINAIHDKTDSNHAHHHQLTDERLEKKLPVDLYLHKHLDRKVLAEVQEKQKTVDLENNDAIAEVQEKQKALVTLEMNDTKNSINECMLFDRNTTETSKVQERLTKKRINIINREINHRCLIPPIALSYTPLNIHKVSSYINNDSEVYLNEKSVKLCTNEAKLNMSNACKDNSSMTFLKATDRRNQSKNCQEINKPATKSEEEINNLVPLQHIDNSKENKVNILASRDVSIRTSNNISQTPKLTVKKPKIKRKTCTRRSAFKRNKNVDVTHVDDKKKAIKRDSCTKNENETTDEIVLPTRVSKRILNRKNKKDNEIQQRVTKDIQEQQKVEISPLGEQQQIVEELSLDSNLFKTQKKGDNKSVDGVVNEKVYLTDASVSCLDIEGGLLAAKIPKIVSCQRTIAKDSDVLALSKTDIRVPLKTTSESTTNKTANEDTHRQDYDSKIIPVSPLQKLDTLSSKSNNIASLEPLSQSKDDKIIQNAHFDPVSITLSEKECLDKSKESSNIKLSKLVHEMENAIHAISKSTIEHSSDPTIDQLYDVNTDLTIRQLNNTKLNESNQLLSDDINVQVKKPKQIANNPEDIVQNKNIENIDEAIKQNLKDATNTNHKQTPEVNHKLKHTSLTNITEKTTLNINQNSLDKVVGTGVAISPDEVISIESDSDSESNLTSKSKAIVNNSPGSNARTLKTSTKENLNGTCDSFSSLEVPKSFTDKIRFEEMPMQDSISENTKCYRFFLPGEKTFKVTINGKDPISVDTLFANPAMKDVLLRGMSCTNEKYIVSVKHLQDREEIVEIRVDNSIATAIQPKPFLGDVETVNLISDDEDENGLQTVATEFGDYTIRSLNKETFAKHINKLSHKCEIKLKRCDHVTLNATLQDSSILSEVKNKVNDLVQKVYDDVLNLDANKGMTTAAADVTNNTCTGHSIPNVLELDDSSNDSVKIFENLCENSTTSQPKAKIDELKNLLLKDLGVEGILTDFPGPNLCDKTETSTSQKCVVKVGTSEDGAKNEGYSEIIKRKCFVQLVRCDQFLNSIPETYVHKSNNDTNVTDNVINQDFDTEDETIENISNSALSRSGSFSILNDIGLFCDDSEKISTGDECDRHSPVIAMFETFATLHDVQRVDTISPVVDIFDIIASLQSKSAYKQDVCTQDNLQLPNDTRLLCDSDWFVTKRHLCLLYSAYSRNTLKYPNVTVSKYESNAKVENFVSAENMVADSLSCPRSSDFVINTTADTSEIPRINMGSVTCGCDWFATKRCLHVQNSADNESNSKYPDLTFSVYENSCIGENNVWAGKENDSHESDVCLRSRDFKMGTTAKTFDVPRLITIMSKYFVDCPLVNQLRPIHGIKECNTIKTSSLMKRKLIYVHNVVRKITKTGCNTFSELYNNSDTRDIDNEIFNSLHVTQCDKPHYSTVGSLKRRSSERGTLIKPNQEHNINPELIDGENNEMNENECFKKITNVDNLIHSTKFNTEAENKPLKCKKDYKCMEAEVLKGSDGNDVMEGQNKLLVSKVQTIKTEENERIPCDYDVSKIFNNSNRKEIDASMINIKLKAQAENEIKFCLNMELDVLNRLNKEVVNKKLKNNDNQEEYGCSNELEGQIVRKDCIPNEINKGVDINLTKELCTKSVEIETTTILSKSLKTAFKPIWNKDISVRDKGLCDSNNFIQCDSSRYDIIGYGEDNEDYTKCTELKDKSATKYDISNNIDCVINVTSSNSVSTETSMKVAESVNYSSQISHDKDTVDVNNKEIVANVQVNDNMKIDISDHNKTFFDEQQSIFLIQDDCKSFTNFEVNNFCDNRKKDVIISQEETTKTKSQNDVNAKASCDSFKVTIEADLTHHKETISNKIYTESVTSEKDICNKNNDCKAEVECCPIHSKYIFETEVLAENDTGKYLNSKYDNDPAYNNGSTEALEKDMGSDIIEVVNEVALTHISDGAYLELEKSDKFESPTTNFTEKEISDNTFEPGEKNNDLFVENSVDARISDGNALENVRLVYKDDSGVILKGIEYDDPIIGTCYVFPITKSSDCSANSDTLNDSDSLIQEIQEMDNGDIIEDERAADSSQVDDLVIQKDITVMVPRFTYSKHSLKRKRDLEDDHVAAKKARRTSRCKVDATFGKTNNNRQKYRKCKNIDCPYFTATAINDSSYLKEYRRLLDYFTSVKFSYSVPYFEKDHIDVLALLKDWPIKELTEIEYPDETKEADTLFMDMESVEQRITDPTIQTLNEEITAEYKEPDFSLNEINENNFNMGFGERSGRVIQNLEDGGAFSKFSAATLSDVKQSQPFLLSEDYNDTENDQIILEPSQKDLMEKYKRYMSYIRLREKVRTFFKQSRGELIYDWIKEQKDKKRRYEVNDNSAFPFDFYISNYIRPTPIETVVQVVQVGQLPVSAAAQNPVTCDPRVTQVSDSSPSQCSVENSPHDDSQQEIKTEYTELTTADLTIPLIPDYAHHNINQSINVQTQGTTNILSACENIPIETELIKSEIKIEIEETTDEKEEYNNSLDKSDSVVKNHVNNFEYSYENNTKASVESNSNVQNLFSSADHQGKPETFPLQKQKNGSSEKTDQIAHAMNAAGISTTSETTDTRDQALVNVLSQNMCQEAVNNSHNSVNNYPKATSINAMSLQEALAQILPPPLNQTNIADNQQNYNTPQVLHIVQGKNSSGNQITLVDTTQQSVITTPNATPVLHIVQNKGGTVGSTCNGNPAPQSNTFSGLSLVDAGLQQGGNQLLHIVNTNQKNNNAGQLLKRVNLLTNLTNVQGTNEQKMVQFVCKSADGKAIQLNAPHQRSMVLRLQPIETPNVQATQSKPVENQDMSSSPNSVSNKESVASQQEIKSRSIYEENYAKFIQSSSNKPSVQPSEKSTSLPKFNQAFGKTVFQDGNQKQNETNSNNSHLSSVNTNTDNTECQQTENSINLEHINQISSPPLLLRKSPAQTSQPQPNLVQQIKQTIAPMNIQTMHGGVIYTRQIPVNIGGGQTINLITVPSTELIDDSSQKQQSEVKFLNQGEMEPSIIKIVPQNQSTPNAEVSSEEGNNNMNNDNAQNPQTQPVLTQMRIKLPMLSKTPQMVSGTRVVRPSFFQIQRNVIGGSNQPVYQQLVLTTAPPLGQQTLRLPQTPARQIKVPTESQSSSELQMSSSTLEQLREFDMVLEQVKERSTVQPNTNSNTTFKLHTSSSDTTDTSASASSTPTETTQQVLYSIGSNQPLNVAYINRKATVTTPTTSTYVRSPDSSGIVDSSTSSTHVQMSHVTADSTPNESPAQPKAAKISSKSKSRPKSSSHTPNSMKINTVPPKTSTQKPLEDEQTTQRILYILAEYKEQVENSPDKDKPAPRRRSNPPSNPSGSSKRKKGSSGSRRPGMRDMSPVHGDDTCRTMGSEDSSCGTSQGDCTESCLETHSPQDSPRKVVRKLTFEQEIPATQPRPQPQRNVIVADGQTIAVARGAPGKPATAVLMPTNYILPVSMVKGGQQIAIVTNRGPKLLTVGGGEGTTNALLLQRLIGPAGLKPVLARPGVRHLRLPTAALHNLQAFNLTTATTVQPPDSTASPAPAPTPPEPVETQATNSPWTDRGSENAKQDRGSSPDGSEPWNLPSSADSHEYSYEETVRADNMDRTVLDPIPDRYSPDMEAQRIFDKMFDVESKKSYIVDSHDDSPRCGYDIDASDCDDKPYHQVVQKKDGSSQRQHRLTHVSAAALRHKYAILEHELRLQKSLSEECEDLGVDSPSASELFPEAELLFAASPAHDHAQEQSNHSHIPQPTLLAQSAIQADIQEQVATPLLIAPQSAQQSHQELDMNLGLEDVGIVTVSEDGMQATIALDQEEFARAHPNTTFHSEPTDDTEVQQPFTITGLKGRRITSTIFHPANRAPTTVLMTAPQATVISQAAPESSNSQNPVKYSDIDMLHAIPGTHINNINLSSVLVKDDGLTRFDNILNDSRELHLSNTASAIVHSTGNATQVIRRVCYDDDKGERDTRFLLDEPEGLIAGDDAKMVAEDSSRDATLESMAGDVDDGNSSPERHAELFWESNSASERSESRRRLDFSSDSDKCCKSPSYDETNSTDSSGVGTHMRLDSVIKEARGVERSGSADGSSADDTHPPLRTYPPKRLYHTTEGEMERSLTGKTRAGERSPNSLEVRRRASGRGVVKRGCHCCNGSPAPPRPKKPRQRKPVMDFTSNN